MTEPAIPLDQVIQGNCIQVLETIPEQTVDIVFADPPYNLQLEKILWRPNLTKVNGVEEAWDQFGSFKAYDQFTEEWLVGCRRVLKDTGTMWVIGSYHNIFRVGRIMQDLGFWILNDVVWIKNNPMPNFHGVRFTNAHETLIWAQKNKGSRYTFNYQAMKSMNQHSSKPGNVQMRSDWNLPLCTGKERIKVNGEKAHPTQKPEALLERVILASTLPGDLVLDPFFGTGTTGAVAKKLGRCWIGIEADPSYVSIARQRIEQIDEINPDQEIYSGSGNGRQKRVPISLLLEKGMLKEGQTLFFGTQSNIQAILLGDGQLRWGESIGSIHKVGREILKAPCNGWTAWYYIDEQAGKKQPINDLRRRVRNEREAVYLPNGVRSDKSV